MATLVCCCLSSVTACGGTGAGVEHPAAAGGRTGTSCESVPSAQRAVTVFLILSGLSLVLSQRPEGGSVSWYEFDKAFFKCLIIIRVA